MDAAMELDDLKQAWAALDRRLARQESLRLHLFRSDRLDKARRGLRPLFWGQIVQILFGAGMVVLGATLWNSQRETFALLVTGLMVHAYGVVTIIASGLVLGYMARIDYAAPVLAIQQRFGALRRVYALTSAVVGLPWWLMWLFVTIAIPGIGGVNMYAAAPVFVWISMAVGVAGLLGTWAWHRWRYARAGKRRSYDEDAACGSLRRAQKLLDEVARFEQE
jgi:hypothetical protein